MMVDEYEHSVTEDCCKGVLLLLPIPNWLRLLNSVCAEVVNSANIHEAENDNTRPGGENLQILRVLDVTKAETNAEGSKDQD